MHLLTLDTLTQILFDAGDRGRLRKSAVNEKSIRYKCSQLSVCETQRRIVGQDYMLNRSELHADESAKVT